MEEEANDAAEGAGEAGGAEADRHIAWALFKKLFFDKYLPTSMSDRMEIKFLDLKQEEMSVTEYTRKFNELARFAPHQVDTERRKARRFEQGLKPWPFNRVTILEIDNFEKLLEKAVIAEGSGDALSKYNKTNKKGNGKKGKWSGNKSGEGNDNQQNKGHENSRKRTTEEGSGGGSNQKKGEEYKTCERNHGSRPCLKGKNVYYKCSQPGHMATNCLNP